MGCALIFFLSIRRLERKNEPDITHGGRRATLSSMKRWNLVTLPPSTEKCLPRDPGPNAPRVARSEGQIPRVLFTSGECRAVLVELGAGEEMGDHRVRERAVIHVTSGRVAVEAAGESVECEPSTLITFDPGETHSVRALSDARLLLILAPWPAAQHYTEAEMGHGRLPANAVVEPLSPGEGSWPDHQT
jgi:quercetin dioxygenase-like cupin family protein